MAIVDERVEQILGYMDQVNPKLRQECEVENRPDGSRMIYGPFPSFLILVEEIGVPRALVHVNADGPNMARIFQFLTEVTVDGPFAVDSETGNLILGPEAYKKKEDNILMFADEIVARRKGQQEGILVPDKKIILTSWEILILFSWFTRISIQSGYDHSVFKR